jgi:hypothetical protein
VDTDARCNVVVSTLQTLHHSTLCVAACVILRTSSNRRGRGVSFVYVLNFPDPEPLIDVEGNWAAVLLLAQARGTTV